MRKRSDRPRIILSPKGEREADEMPRPAFRFALCSCCCQSMNLMVESVSEAVLLPLEIEVGLEVEPQLWRDSEVAP